MYDAKEKILEYSKDTKQIKKDVTGCKNSCALLIRQFLSISWLIVDFLYCLCQSNFKGDFLTCNVVNLANAPNMGKLQQTALVESARRLVH